MKKKSEKNSRKVGFTCGAFDVFHAGHILMIEEARKNCDFLVVGLQTDPTLDRPHKNKPIQTLKERKIQLKNSKFIDKIIVYSTEADLYELLKELRPAFWMLGSDWKGKKYTGYDLGLKILWHNRNHNYSSTNLRERILKAELKKRGMKLP